MEKCPICNNPLETVQVEIVQIVEWNNEEKKYKDNGQGSTAFKCYRCGGQVGFGDANRSEGIEIEFE